MQISFAAPEIPEKGSVVVGCFEDRTLTQTANELDNQLSGILKKMMGTSTFNGKSGQILISTAPADSAYDHLILLGLGKPEDLSINALTELGGNLYASLNNAGIVSATVVIGGEEKAASPVFEQAAHVAYGAILRSYRFDKYKTKVGANAKVGDKTGQDDKSYFTELTVASSAGKDAEAHFEDLKHLADGVFLTRDLLSEPANILYPESFADRLKEMEKLGVKVTVLDEAAMEKLGFGALLGVGYGSERESRLVIMEHNGGKKGDAPVALVGKGVCFDTGGISIKPSNGMEEMKWDMGGAGVVSGVMHALAARKAKMNLIGVVGLVENMPDGRAQRPGDIVTSYSGQTIEVINTDAEGRLVLADALWYTQEKFQPKIMIDLATLTGAAIVALGSEYAAVMSNRDELPKDLYEAGMATGEKVWHLPLTEGFDKQINSEAADMRNISRGREAGTSMAGQFLKRFVKDETPWMHIDVAAVEWSKKDTAVVPKGATAFGVRLLHEYLTDHFEDK